MPQDHEDHSADSDVLEHSDMSEWEPENEYDTGDAGEMEPADSEAPATDREGGEDEQAGGDDSGEAGDVSQDGNQGNQSTGYYSPDTLDRAQRLGFSVADVKAMGDPQVAHASLLEIENRRLRERGTDASEDGDGAEQEEEESYTPQLGDDFDDEVKQEFGRLNDFYQDKIKKLEGRIEDLSTKTDERDKATQKADNMRAMQAFDNRIASYDREDLFGKGVTERDVSPGTEAYRNRQKIAANAAALMNAQRALGEEVDEDAAYEQAFRAAFSGNIENEATGKVASTLERNKGQVISRPSGRKNQNTLTPEQKAQARVNKFITSHMSVGGDDEGDDLF